MRKLASIQRVDEVQPIDGSDFLEKVRIKGWWIVTKKGQVKQGDLCIYYEVDSLLPARPQYDFLAKGQTLKKSIIESGKEVEGYRLKTIRLRGQISQGLVLPLSEFPEVTTTELEADLTDILSIYKYEAPVPACISGEAKGMFPGFLSKTDEDRIQNLPWILEKYRGQRFYRTSKIDGTSCTIYKHENELNVCGRTINYKESTSNSMWRLAHQYDLKNKLPNGFAIQAECAGEGIQGNRHKLKGQDLFIFYVIEIDTGKYLKLEDMKAFVNDALDMKTVPIIDDNFIMDHTIDELLELANAPCPLNTTVPQEGTVFRLYDSTEKITFKAISNEYLLKYGL